MLKFKFLLVFQVLYDNYLNISGLGKLGYKTLHEDVMKFPPFVDVF